MEQYEIKDKENNCKEDKAKWIAAGSRVCSKQERQENFI